MSKKIGKSDIGKSRDRGSRGFKSHIVDKEGNVMLIAEKDIITTPPTNSIKNVAKLMKEHDFRRIPVTDAGTNRLEGMAVAIDILDFLGGGEKYNIIREDYNGNFLSAINCPIHKIMRQSPVFLDKKASIDDVVDIIISEHSSSISIVEDRENKEVIGIVTERDVLPTTDSFGVPVEDVMQKKCITSSPGMMISDVSKVMVRSHFRRLPVILEDNLIGIVTVFDILKFLGYGGFKGIDAEEILSTRIDDVMEKNVITLAPDQDIGEVSKLVRDTGKGGFPIIDDGKLIGIITTSDIIKEIYDK